MKITAEDVARIAHLARLELTPEKAALFAPQLGQVLEYMDKLGQVPTEDVEPMYTPVEHVTVLRPDEVRREFTREEILANAPEDDGQFFIVPKIV
ncbi:Aspartyl/glutamyl-tRNA(Asn/Gln) amidotransferase subunit C [Desulfovibrio sp. X2]|uniref:Asp-tRNA(Asn)/Glu-tRNA(Gln) amidotransferase subunit GatC n=1 Tax=Desulfovibrio sp. X2 TaxID=941449 RepID=UPI000358B36B|nr:Asp-tRNA(Asn)/Glu-tRNA(Gln) amidotransferase subunit GatC [Desulfovibrio sp. X2]EPR41459.1 Aspartyl/glutamyl-tRNA(Asn/Gln) amidotransferase subunit C [Desulfovibrio sp. X2]